ncbi:class I SAM-dependent methyltransferase [Pelagibacteraceae bacterium]|nr:class I SAM-dependent methyltransferase [Pelagibacteraceae bacterium]
MRKKINKIIKNILPPIFYPSVFREIFGILVRGKDKIKYENNFYSRHAFINKAISKFQNCKYLEIGVNDNSVFNTIPLPIENKFGVDPEKGGNLKMTSDEFFKINNEKFDVVFIDGLHHFEQCRNDCINSLECLKPDGIIFIHDLLPRNFLEEKVPRVQTSWTGDIWKISEEILISKNIDFKIVNIDMGIGILKPKKNFEYKIISGIENKKYNDFLKLYPHLPIINSKEALLFI